MSNHEVVGIVGGYGDLGRQLAVQAGVAASEVLIYDVPGAVELYAVNGVDPELSASSLTVHPEFRSSLDDLVRESGIVHWCAPISALDDLGDVGEDTLLVLHDSVMNTSASAEMRLLDRPNFAGRLAVAHCLMNKAKTVVLDLEAPGVDEATRHFIRLGLNPNLMTHKQHDFIMARSQGLFALLIEASDGFIDGYAKEGLLTPSGEHFKEARDDRDSKWTRPTKQSIFSNPELKKLLHELLGVLENPGLFGQGEVDTL